jgi:hypothetical protein
MSGSPRGQQEVDGVDGVGNVVQQRAVPIPDDVVDVSKTMEQLLHAGSAETHGSPAGPACRGDFLS